MLVYIREAHALDSELPMMFGLIEDPTSQAERHALARLCNERLGLRLPTVVDQIDDAVGRAYQAWPERLYLVARDGEIRYRGGPGPFGFDPDGFEAAIRKLLAAE